MGGAEPETPPQATEAYLNLARELSTQVAALRNLWKERDSLLAEESRATSNRATIANRLFEAKIGGNSGELRKQLEALNADREELAALVEGAREAIDAAEAGLHAKLPLATEAINRLHQAGAKWLVERDFQKMLAIIHPSQQSEALRAQVGDLAARSVDFINFKAFCPGPCPFLAIQPITDNQLKEWSKERRQTLEMVCQLAEDLSDKTIQILDKLESADSSFHVPPLKLELDKPTPEQLAEASGPDSETLKWLEPLGATLDERFQELMEARAQNKLNAGLRPDDPFRSDELQILAHHLDVTLEEALQLGTRYQQQRIQQTNRVRLQQSGGMRVGI